MIVMKFGGTSLADAARIKAAADIVRGRLPRGPIVVVYPEGTWYQGMTAERIPLFVQQHLVEGRPVEEWVFARNPVPNENE